MPGIFLVVLSAVMAALKITGVSSISWMWVFAPLWMPAMMFLLVYLGALVLALAVTKNS